MEESLSSLFQKDHVLHKYNLFLFISKQIGRDNFVNSKTSKYCSLTSGGTRPASTWFAEEISASWYKVLSIVSNDSAQGVASEPWLSASSAPVQW